MIGSSKDQFFPCAVNCHLFQPDEERSNIMLHSSDDAPFNIEILTETAKLYTKFLYEVEKRDWAQIERLCKIKAPEQLKDKESFDREYIKKRVKYHQQIFNPMLQAVLNLKIIKNMKGKKVKVRHAQFPEIEKADLADKNLRKDAQVALVGLY
jgi:hypothetical protein